MGAPKQKWTSEEEEALRAGVAKHGTGKWKNIQKDPEFGHCLAARSNIDLKDKWRNMSVSAGQGSRDKFRSPKPKPAIPTPPTPTPTPTPSITRTTTTTTPSSSTPHDAMPSTLKDSSKSPVDAKNPQRYTPLIVEAISTMKDPNGSDISSIIGFIEEQRHEVPPNFRKLLSTKLRRLVGQGKLEKVQNCYKIPKESGSGQKASGGTTQKEKDGQRSKQSQTPAVETFSSKLEQAAYNAAYAIADAENKAFMAAEAVKESERVAKMAEDSDSLLQLAKDVHDICNTDNLTFCLCSLSLFHFLGNLHQIPVSGCRGEIVLMA
ncbi:hypothetical protein IFM89_002197 [Coptis chinensis]|uniref:MYB transcription factor n=1 Tax=Coptis chinensis TaxID=261450 RepID=A0A835I7D3_9MAGN|nr:hypothetical protein IFM89_002197 [Coptis chinensis]